MSIKRTQSVSISKPGRFPGHVQIGVGKRSYIRATYGSSELLAPELEYEAVLPGLANYIRNLDSEEPVAYLSNLFVDPKDRRQGVGTSLFGRMLDELRGLGVKQVYLHASTPAGVRFLDTLPFAFEQVDCCQEDQWPLILLELT